jgi:glycosyltransferase involved in cell wall biosynthesis
MVINEDALISIVVITYNNSNYIEETLESIKSQTYNNIELIVSDDCSTDKTVEITEECIDKNRDRFANVKLITTPVNTGISKNCNRGLRECSGKWLKVIAGDDILLNNFIKDNIEFTYLNPGASIIFSNVCEIDENSNLVRSIVVNEGQEMFANISTAKKQLKYYSRWPVFLNTPTFFIKRDLFKLVGYCDEEFRIYEDMSTLFRVLENGYKIYHLDETTVAYRVHSKAVSRDMKKNGPREKEALRIFEKYQMKNLNILNPFDLSIYYENWLRFKYRGFFGLKGDSILRKLSLYYWYMRLNGVKTY